VTLHALWEFNLSKVRDVPSAFEFLDGNTERIKEAASAKFDREGVDEDDRYEDRPTLIVRSDDIPDNSGA